jgi:hydrogenase maturation protease
METKRNMTTATQTTILVIGYGSSLRSDDAVGRVVAERIAERRWWDVAAISVTQLVPELAEQIASASAAIFIDASPIRNSSEVDAYKLTGGPSIGRTSHASGPHELLAIAATCYGRTPPAWLVTVPAADIQIAEQLSRTTSEQIQTAIRVVERLVDEFRPEGPLGRQA